MFRDVDSIAASGLLEFRTPFHQLECCVGTHVCVTRPCPYGSMEAWMRGLPNLPVPLHPNSGRNLVEEQSMYLMHWSIAVNDRCRPPSQSHLNGKVQPNRSRVDLKLTAYGNVDCQDVGGAAAPRHLVPASVMNWTGLQSTFFHRHPESNDKSYGGRFKQSDSATQHV